MTRIYPRSALALLLAFGSASSVVVIAVPIDVNLGSSFTGAASSSCSSTMAPTHTVESTAVTSVSTASAGPSSVLDAAPTRHFPEADADNFLPGTVPKVLQVEQVELNRDSIFKHQRRAQSGEAKNPKNLLSLSDLPWPPSYELATEKLPSYKNAVKKLPAPPTLTYQVVHHPVTGVPYLEAVYPDGSQSRPIPYTFESPTRTIRTAKATYTRKVGPSPT
ncbi:hypothetical protein F5878DRAFT_630940 [Lentinula raphanica]|uniref:Uncharacterized protein n=1 Tax=Lentinula raphanica TaxID=153919 RepID=A0AA38U8G4_9AGAR|nr:hypothetical protein F5878DRAFT_630940 [Lentinula raphanica]